MSAGHEGTSAGRRSDPSRSRRGLATFLREIGPEIISGASDNDPTNVGTAASVGAQTGYQLSWVALLVAPLLGVVQTIAAQLGAVSHDDLQSLTRRRFGRGVSFLFLASVIVVNLITIAADLQAGAAGLGLLLGIDDRGLVIALGVGLGALLVLGPYQVVTAILRYLLLGFLAFGAAAILARPNWPELVRGSLVPSLSLHGAAASGALALLGTTLTSYVYVWETIGRGVEEPPAHEATMPRIRRGAVLGAVFTALVLWWMLVASAATLGVHHQPVTSAADAARALHPLAGSAATYLFAFGLVVSALVALPVLLATTAYVVGAHFGWRRGLSERVGAAPAFYVVMALSVVLALAVTQAGVSVVGMLVLASVVGGLGTPLGLVLLVRLASDPGVMGSRRISRRLAVAGWTVAFLVGALGVTFLFGAVA